LQPTLAVLVDYDEDLFAPQGWEGKHLAEAGIDWRVGQHRTPETALSFARGAEIVMVQSVRKLMTRATIEGLASCHCIVRLGIGYDTVDLAAATERGILVCNTPLYCVPDVADHALALLLAAVRHIARQDRWIRAGRWDRTGARPARRTTGATLGLVGFGRIARKLAQQVSGFGMRLLAYDPYVGEEAIAGLGVQKVDLDTLLRRSDFVSIHVPLTSETRHLLGAREFALMKDGAFLVNTSRGPLVDEAALVGALHCGKLSGAGLDVMETEPLSADSPLREMENVTLTPHVSANSTESVTDLYMAACQIAIDVAAGRWPASVVNPEVAKHLKHSYQPAA
jgi:D-3-phosphoglycerate dehydrogenase